MPVEQPLLQRIYTPSGSSILHPYIHPEDVNRLANDERFELPLPDKRSEAAWDALHQKIEGYMTPVDRLRVRNAYTFGSFSHALRPKDPEKAFRKDGNPYITHPLAVAHILADLRCDVETIQAALLHDVLEDTHTSEHEIRKRFGDTVADTVVGVTEVRGQQSTEDNEAETLKKLYLALEKNPRVILVKLADRLHNMRTIHSLSEKKRRRIAGQTLRIFVPLAQKVGMLDWADEMTVHSFRVLYDKGVDDARDAQSAWIKDVISDTNVRGIGRELQRQIPGLSVFASEPPTIDQFLELGKSRVVSQREPADISIVAACPEAMFPHVVALFEKFIADSGTASLTTYAPGRVVQGAYRLQDGRIVRLRIRTLSSFERYFTDISHVYRYGLRPMQKQRVQRQFSKKMENTLQALHEFQTQELSAQQFVERVAGAFDRHQTHFYTPTGERIRIQSPATVGDAVAHIHGDLLLTTTRITVDGKPANMTDRIYEGSSVDAQKDPDEKWQISCAVYNALQTQEAIKPYRDALKQFLSYQNRLLHGHLVPTEEDDFFQISRWTMRDWEERASILTNDAEIRGVSRLVSEYGNRAPREKGRHFISDTPLVNLSDVWQFEPTIQKLKTRYWDYPSFVRMCALKQSQDPEIQAFVSAVLAYERRIRTVVIPVLNRPAILQQLAAVPGSFGANIEQIEILNNQPDIPLNFVNVKMMIHPRSADIENVLQSLRETAAFISSDPNRITDLSGCIFSFLPVPFSWKLRTLHALMRD